MSTPEQGPAPRRAAGRTELAALSVVRSRSPHVHVEEGEVLAKDVPISGSAQAFRGGVEQWYDKRWIETLQLFMPGEPRRIGLLEAEDTPDDAGRGDHAAQRGQFEPLLLIALPAQRIRRSYEDCQVAVLNVSVPT